MTTYRSGIFRRAPRPQPTERAASGFELWTWASRGEPETPGPDYAERMAIQVLHARRWSGEQLALDDREDECWRMFGVSVEYYQDERVVSYGS